VILVFSRSLNKILLTPRHRHISNWGFLCYEGRIDLAMWVLSLLLLSFCRSVLIRAVMASGSLGTPYIP
jgi:hypothetical protein